MVVKRTPDHPKESLRSKMKETLSLCSRDFLLGKSERVYYHLKNILDDHNIRHRLTFPKSIVVGVYAPIAGEVTFASLENDFVCAYPSFDNQKSEMVFRESKLSELVESREFGVVLKTPPQSSPCIKPDVILIPGLAFSKKGERLGRGKGFYDRYLQQYGGLKIGVCFSEQLVDHVPVEKHDQIMKYVVCDQGVFTNE